MQKKAMLGRKATKSVLSPETMMRHPSMSSSTYISIIIFCDPYFISFACYFFLFIVCCLRNKWRGASLLLGSGEYNFRQHVYMILFVIPISSIDFHCSRHSSFHVRSNSQKKKTPVIIVSMCSVFCVHSHDYVHLKSNGNHGIHNLSRAHDLEWNVIEI